MKKRFLLLACAIALVLVSNAVAQTKISGSLDCDKSDPLNVIQIPDRAGYSYAIGQNKCVWTKSMTIEGIETKEFINTGFTETMGATIRTTGAGVSHYAGDKAYSHSTGTLERIGGMKALSEKWKLFPRVLRCV